MGLSAVAAKPDWAPPKPAPPIYVTHNHGIRADIPAGLTYCPLPSDWMGSDHGTTLYLVPPRRCGRTTAYPSTNRRVSNPVPSIDLYYGFNVAEINRRDAHSSPPRTSAEYVNAWCEKPSQAIPVGLTLLGAPALGCRHDQGSNVVIELMAVYSWQNSESDVRPERELVVTLSTTKERIEKDLRTFGLFAAGIRLCTPNICPQSAHWW
jgi:hypothetical protein